MKTNKRRQTVNTKKIIVVLIIIVLVLFAAFLGLRYLKTKISERFASKDANTVETAQVTIGSISSTVYGKGALANEESETITLPSTVEVTEVCVSAGDDIKEGDLLISVNISTVLQAMAEKQSEIDDIDKEIAEISENTLDEKVKASVSGRVKQIFATEGGDVTDIMSSNGELIALSLDGYMAVNLKKGTLEKNSIVTVYDAEGTAYEGKVASVSDGIATVLITDDGPLNGAVVRGEDDNGNSLGTGTLYIHEPLPVVGFTGMVSEIKISENSKVKAGDILLTLTDVSYSTNYATLLSQRQELEQDLLDLMTVYREGGLYAHAEGTVTAVSVGTYTTAQKASTTGIQSSFSIGGQSMSETKSSGENSDTTISYCSNRTMQISVSVDEADVLSLSTGQEASVYISSLSEDPFTGTVTDIGTEGTSSNGTTTYSVGVRLSKDKGMLAGMTASVYITIEGMDNALLIPAEALNETSTTAYVFTAYDEENDELGGMVEVEVGLKNNRYAEICSGLSEGDTVYYKESTSENKGFSFGGGDMPGFSFGGNDMPNGFGGGNMPGGFGGGNVPGGSGRGSGRNGSSRNTPPSGFGN